MARRAAQSTPNQLLRQARLERGWTQKDVAGRIGAPLDLNVTRWERGTVRPSAYYVQRLCELFGKSPGELGLLPEHPQLQEADTSNQQDPRPASVPQQLWNVPFRRNPFFTGRIELLQELHNRLQKEQRSAFSQAPALTGLGGIGKTQLAVEYAYRYSEEYRAVFWTRAESRETLAADFAGLAQLLGLSVRDARDQSLIVAAVKRWLVQHEGWLLILDNADDLPLVVDFLPVEGQGHILLTTRAQATGNIARNILVEQMESSEGTRLLLRRAKLLDLDAPLDAIPAETLAKAQAIVKVLDGLPLALDQAGAYIEETGCSLSDYLALYERHRSALLKRPGLATSYPHTVASTWSLAFARVAAKQPAADLLRLCAFLAPDAIPEEVLTAGASQLGPAPASVVANGLLLNQAIEALRAYSLVQRDPAEKSLSVHRLVQAVLQDALSETERRAWAERAMRAVNAALPAVNAALPDEQYDTWVQCERLLPQALAVAQSIEQYQLTSEEAGRLLYQTAVYLQIRARYTEAVPLFQRAWRIWEQQLGPEHPLVASLLYDLADLYLDQGKYTEAEPLFQRALRIREQALGPEHPWVAYPLNDLANLYREQGKYAEAELLYQGALRIWEQAYGAEHPHVAFPLNGLASLYREQGRYTEAEPLYQRALSLRKQALAPEHPHTAETIHDLAQLWEVRGNREEAMVWYVRALAMRERALGTQHPRTRETRSRLMALLHALGRHEQAAQLEIAQVES